MTSSGNLLPRFIKMEKGLHTSLRLKEVLEATVAEFSAIAGGAKVAVFLADNEGMAFKLMSSTGYTEQTLEYLRSIPFTAESLFKYIVQKREPAFAAEPSQAPDMSASVMQREASQGQIVLPLLATNLLVGALQIDMTRADFMAMGEFLKEAADLAAIAIANSILFGRSEFEKERLNTLYKTSCALSSSTLKIADILQICADTSLVIGNTPNCAILMIDQETFRVAAFKGLEGASLHDFDLGLSGTIAGRCLVSGKTEHVQDAASYSNGLPRSSDGSIFGSVLALPMVYENEHLGVLMIFSTDTRAFNREQIELVESFVQQVATSLHVALTHESAAAQSIQDAHTGLYNRWHFEDQLAKEIERSQRHRREMSIMVIDVDHLSHINEYFGQDKGDEAIKHVAHVIKDALRDIDIPCRSGGEEFAIILPETPQQNAYDVAERLRQKVRSEQAPGIGIITISIGLSSFPENAEDGEGVLRAAVQALDVAKFEGRDRVKVAQNGQAMQGPISWEDLAKQARLSVISERQAQSNHKLAMQSDYQPWMRSQPGLTTKKKPNE